MTRSRPGRSLFDLISTIDVIRPQYERTGLRCRFDSDVFELLKLCVVDSGRHGFQRHGVGGFLLTRGMHLDESGRVVCRCCNRTES